MIEINHFTHFQFFSVFSILSLLIILTIRIVNDRYRFVRYRILHLFISVMLMTEVFSCFVILVTLNKSNVFLIFIVIGILYQLLLILALFTADKNIGRIIFFLVVVVISLGISYWCICQNIKCIILFPFISSLEYLFLSEYIIRRSMGMELIYDIQNVLSDAILIVNTVGETVFSSKKFRDSGIFRQLDCIDPMDPKRCFKFLSKEDSYQDINYFKVESKPPTYIRYSHTAIHDGGKVAGYIMTFSDISNLMEKLFELALQVEEEGWVNESLEKSSFQLAKSSREKEITLLIEEIGKNHTLGILKLKESLNEINFEDVELRAQLEDLMEEGRHLLKGVREVVSSYCEEGGIR